ncbi:MAG: EAL domain-containing protein [Gammaproteobacteria bacterium]|nr:EAL domain-containing protein [Gammaproteobacteria bacterium]
MYSMSYIPAYQLWAMTLLPQSRLVEHLNTSIIQHVIIFILVFSIIYFLFLYINRIEQAKRRQLINQANQDFLTGLSNRLYLKYAEPKWVREGAEPFSVIFMDLDNFKNINDSYGHSYGDLILKQVAKRLVSIFNDEGLVCRQGGDEFIILYKKVKQKNLDKIAIKVLAEISKPYNIENYKFTIGASIGICRYPADGDSFDSLFSAADTAMYQAKYSKSNYFIFTRELKEQIYQTSQIEQALHIALKNHEFHMVYQPQIASKGALYGVEALVRWSNPELGLIPPDKFIPIAEDSGLILELGHFIIDQSIKDIAKLSNINDSIDLQLSINISVRQFLEFGFLDRLKNSLLSHKFPSRQLTLEITESIFIDDFDYMLPLFQEIRSLGIKISLDDFGTGFSSLSMLKNLPIDELKIDKSFIDNISNNTQDRAMVINILNIASNLGLKVVAEGIELPKQAEMLSDFKCDIQQGYFYSRPVKLLELEQYCSSYINASHSPANHSKQDKLPESSDSQKPY